MEEKLRILPGKSFVPFHSKKLSLGRSTSQKSRVSLHSSRTTRNNNTPLSVFSKEPLRKVPKLKGELEGFRNHTPTSLTTRRTQVQDINKDLVLKEPFSTSSPENFTKTKEEATKLYENFKTARKSFLSTCKKVPGAELVTKTFESIQKVVLQQYWFSGEGRVQVAKNLIYLEKVFYKMTSACSQKLTQLEKELNESLQLLEKNLTNKYQVVEFSEMLKGSQQKLSQAQTKREKASETLKNKQKNWVIEKQQLLETISSLENYISKIDNYSNSQELQQEICDLKELLKTNEEKKNSILESKNLRIFKLEQQLDQTKCELQQNKSFVNNFSSTKDNLENQIKNYKKKLLNVEEKHRFTTESLMMVNEDISRVHYLKQELSNTRQKLKETKHKYEKLRSKAQLENIQTKGLSQMIKIDLNDSIFNLFNPKLQNHFASPESQRKADFQNLDISRFKLSKPSYAELCEPQNKLGAFKVPWNNWLKVTIRGILDSKHYEHLLGTEKLQSFPEFVYCWMGDYEVDKNTRLVKSTEVKTGITKNRIVLLYGLYHEKAQKLWELKTFRDFLTEEHGTDELYFFLDCRDKLYSGPQLMSTEGKFQSIHYVKLEHCFNVIDSVMHRMPSKEVSDLKQMIASRSRKAKELLVDSAFVLRVMLEYYIAEKRKKYLYIQELFEISEKKHLSDGSATVSFETFKEVCSELREDLTEAEVVKLYRQAWSLGQGVISADTFFLAANESDFFLKSLCLSKPRNNELETLESQVYMQNIKSLFELDPSFLKLLKKCISVMGVPDLKHSFNKIEQNIIVIKNTSSIQKGPRPKEVFKDFFQLVNSVSLASENFNHPKTLEKEFLESLETPSLNINFETLLLKIKHFLLNEIKKHLSIRKIQKTFKNALKR